jgi:hypothetical protein
MKKDIKNKEPIEHYGVTETQCIETVDDVIIEEMDRNGFAVIPNVFTPGEMVSASDKLDSISGILNAKNSSKNVISDDIIRCPMVYDEYFLKLATNDLLVKLSRKILGENIVLLMQNAIINRPEKKQIQVKWHRDLNYQHWVCSKPLAIHYLICIDKFYEKGGCTWCLPGSHLHEKFPSNGFIQKNEIPLEAEIGSVVLMNAMTYHRAGKNIDSNYTRRAINHVVGKPLLAQQIDIPLFLAQSGKDFSADKFLSRYLGYSWNPAKNNDDWQNKRKK